MSGVCLIACLVGVASMALGQMEPPRPRQRSFYVGLGGGPTQFKTGDDEREMDGLSFRFETDDDDLGLMAFAGYWISDNIGIEVGSRSYGTVDVDFEFSNPHDGTSGTGASEVSINGIAISLVFGYDVFDTVQVYVRAGALMWQEDFDSRFDIPGEPAIQRTTDDSGTGGVYGGGVSWRFHDTWQLHAQYDYAALGDDDVGMASLGLSYDCSGLLR
jgi:opacity protein-like surface antigen